MKAKPIVGRTVAYSAQFLKNIGAQTGELPQWRGEIKSVQEFGEGKYLVTVLWAGQSRPSRALASNLAYPGPNIDFCSC